MIISFYFVYNQLQETIAKQNKLMCTINEWSNCAGTCTTGTRTLRVTQNNKNYDFYTLCPLPTCKPITKVYPPREEPKNIFGSDTSIEIHYNDGSIYEIHANYTYTAHGNIKSLVDTDKNSSWVSLYNVYFPGFTGEVFFPNKTATQKTNGCWLKYKLPEKISLSILEIASPGNRPGTWDLYGSNDNNTWELINTGTQTILVDDMNYKENIFMKSLTIPSKPYMYFAIIITGLASAGGNFTASVGEIRFHGIKEL